MHLQSVGKWMLSTMLNVPERMATESKVSNNGISYAVS